MRRITTRVTAAAILAGVAFSMLGAKSGQAVDGGPYPGLPAPELHPPPVAHRSWGGAGMASLANSEKAKQWLRTPVMTSVFDFYTGVVPPPDPSRHDRCNLTGANVYLVAEPGATHNYGISREMTVRTAAFGTIPVEATVRLEQRRVDGLPIPISIETLICRNLLGGFDIPDAEIRNALHTRVMAIVVDGVPMRLTGTCRTRTPGTMQLHGKGYTFGWDGSESVLPPAPPLWDRGFFNLSPGGELAGTIDVLPFSGCVTADGDDLSALLTATVSGSDFPLRTHQGAAFGCTTQNPAGGTLPPGPGEATVDSVPCNPRGVPHQIPPALEIPDGDR